MLGLQSIPHCGPGCPPVSSDSFIKIYEGFAHQHRHHQPAIDIEREAGQTGDKRDWRDLNRPDWETWIISLENSSVSPEMAAAAPLHTDGPAQRLLPTNQSKTVDCISFFCIC